MIVEGKSFDEIEESPAVRMLDTIFDLVEDIEDMKEKIQINLPKSREASLAITKLDEARLWLKEISFE